MKILSFDVGVKNLAYCLLDDNNYIIEDWGILNISIDDVCEYCGKNNKKCEKSAKYKTIDNIKLCSSHKLLKCYKDKKMNLIKKDNSILKISSNLVDILDSKDNFKNVDTVLIENQPALKNPTMKSIQMILYTYFVINGVKNVNSTISNIEMINARNKLKCYNGPIVKCDIKDKYKRTKYLGIKYCEYMIIENKKIEDKYKNLFNTSKKKDDLSDCYLQGMYWLTK